MHPTLRTIDARVPDLANARGAITARTAIILAIEHGGHIGLGEAAPLPGFSRENIDDVRDAIEKFRWPVRSPRELGEIDVLARSIASPSARFAVECALLDLAAQHRGVPLWRLLADEEPPAIENTAALWAGDRASLAAAAKSAARASVRTIKVKSIDVDDLACVREILPDVDLRIDANGTIPQQSLTSTLERLGSFRPVFVEEPSDFESTLSLRESPVPIALDESIAASNEIDARFERALASPAVSTIVLKPALLGGLLRTRSIALRVRKCDRAFVVSHLLDGEIARAACAHLALALGGIAAGLGDHPALSLLSHGRSAPWIGPAWIEPPTARGLGLRK